MNVILFIIILFNVNKIRFVLGSHPKYTPMEDSQLSIEALIRKYGYPCEVYDIVTEDGYIIKAHRIPHGRNGNSTKFKASVILQHGLTGCSSNFLMAGADNSIGYVLADEGYDVWLPDARGNYYSRMHTKLNPNFHQSYWNFSFHEIGVYDIPATIDFILNKTKQDKLFHIGHSQGNTVFYVMASERPEYNDKIIAHFTFAPTAYFNHITNSFMLLLVSLMDFLKDLGEFLGIYEVLPGMQQLRVIGSRYCADEDFNKNVCANVVQGFFGYNWKELNMTLIAITSGHIPAGASAKQVLHYGQLIKSGRFCQYDYGRIGNMKEYNLTKPPDYNMTKVTAPVHLFCSVGDTFSDIRDSETLKNQLPNVKTYDTVDDPQWTHVDYIIGLSCKRKVTDKTIAYMNKYLD